MTGTEFGIYINIVVYQEEDYWGIDDQRRCFQNSGRCGDYIQRILVEKYWRRIHDLSDRAVHLIAEHMDSTSFTLAFASRIYFHSC